MGRKDKSETRKPEILENFFEVMKEEGLEGASIAKIAKRMDIHPSLIIHYFKTKENMVMELASMMFEKYVITHIADITKIANAEERLDALIDMMLFRDTSRKDERRTIFPALTYLASRNNDIKKKLRQNIDQIHRVISEELLNLMEIGVIKKTDPEMLVGLMGMIGTGLEHHMIMSDKKKFDDDMMNFLRQTVKSILV